MAGLPRERLSVATVAVGAAGRMLADTLEYAKTREAFGRPIDTFQHSRFQLGTMKAELTIAQVFHDHCVTELDAGSLSVTDAAKVKWWTTELQGGHRPPLPPDPRRFRLPQGEHDLPASGPTAGCRPSTAGRRR
ncbi:acyl-CoA dehydrogenase family protein [Streptomyces sp. NPDC087219]|uniref:acyl-CoA dehydrogenase family protein n=1 Tax=Streptomyces sp. NPDC087219 TaxID=3365770 RepID=UPI003808DD36